ncbi:AraC family transcriptional regulator [Anaerobacillus sp. CMMVII]|uniref:helix-turn-helix transcriptional regulator n=1 Tax=Anaerobacillus sp. CMMVII TaxID=2755588 RepID=UPI0021B7A912|nr:AraC family transcriptional regulator [Anaerobacillus sp. CMMVII]MCT8137880.1 AraC family transcriptional regulator [Anaerobacillus sp. CMMVII]
MNTLSFQVPPFPTYITGRIDFFPKGTKHIKRVFSVFDILFVKEGIIHMDENGVLYDIKQGEYLILVPGFEHFSYKACETDTVYYWLHFQLEVPYELKNYLEINWGMILKQERTYTEAAKHVFHIPRYGKIGNQEFIYHELDRLFSTNETNAPEKRLKEQIIFQELIIQLQSDAIRIPTSADQVTKQTITYIQENYKEATLKMSHIAKELLFHPDYITRCMQKTIGITPMQYLTSFRLSLAKELLTTTNEKLETISKKVGINDFTYFSRLFKKIEGITPIEFRRIAKREGK